MALKFVNTTADKREPDKKTRKQIRSQVMKGYRRRREGKEQEGEEGRSREGSVMGEASLQPGSSTLGQAPSRPSLSRSSSKRALQQSIPNESTTLTNSAFGERSTKRGRPSNVEKERAASLFLQTAHGLFSNFVIDTINTSEPAVMGSNVAHDDAEVSRMIEICNKFNEWLVADRTSIAGLMSYRQPYNTSTGLLQLYALSLMSIGHLSSIRVFRGDEERAYYKARLLELASKLLQDPAKAREDATLCALACLASYEISFSSHEALTHLSGISRIIEWRGGLDELNSMPGLAMLLQVLDLLHAVSFHVEPLYTRSATVLTDGASNDDTSETSPENNDLTEAAHEWQDILREAASSLRDAGDVQASRACFLTWRLLLFQPRDDETWTIRSDEEMEELYRVMTTASWAAHPALQARVLLTALATDTDEAHKSWYYSNLAHLMFHTQALYWDDLIRLVGTFIDSQAHYRRPQVQTVRAMVSGVEIVIERSLAAYFGLQTVQS